MTTATNLFYEWLRDITIQVEFHLESILPSPTTELNNAMRYAVLDGGKRLRPAIILAVCGVNQRSLNAACSLELIHCYSLVHDDLPCMDNDDMRRNKPSCHKKYGEAMALLAGDCLQSLAFTTISNTDLPIYATHLLGVAAGHQGMGGGQAIDITNSAKSAAEITHMHHLKTGALFQCALQLAILCKDDCTQQEKIAIEKFGHLFGLLFQIANDIQDYEQDMKAKKMTYATMPSIDPAKHAQSIKDNAINAIEPFFPRLVDICHQVYNV